ncbi:MAG: undecaprenyl-diphosphate phosphatase [Bacteroidia bacterium]|nr:undecaprenyl-diphosphate phosphatase [Bacteroidia bacterium]MBP9688552.1 undecaprenyl-diphosphate phosphatase [Bacteroidia bacterium]
MSIFEAVVLAIVEGLTEFLPVSSTGHMVLASSVMGISNSEFVKMFTVAIQFGAILSVVVLYWKRFLQSFDFYFKLGVAFIPAAVFGLLFNDYIDALLENALVVAISLLLGGIVLLFVDKWFAKTETAGATQVEYKNAFVIGMFQVIAMIPGVSRSAATIIGGLSQKLTRTAAAEFSFFLAVPTMFAATAYKMLKYHNQVGFNSSDMGILVIGNVVAFVVAIIAIKAFIGFLTKHGFKMFGWYRIILGAAILILYAMGHELTIL